MLGSMIERNGDLATVSVTLAARHGSGDLTDLQLLGAAVQ
jgi:hypothetical protein